MLKKYRNSISLTMMIVITCITQVFTLMKSSLVAGQFGTTMEMDAYNFANSIVSFVFGFVASAISTVIIPSYVEKTHKKEVNAFLTAIYGILGVVIVLILLLRYQIVGLFTSKSEMYVNIACNVLIVLMLTNMLYSVTNITAAHFQCIGKYNIPKILNLLSQVIIVAALLIFQDISIYQYALILSAGLLINVIIDVALALKNGWRYKPSFLFRSPETKKLFKLFLPIVFSTGIYKLSLVIDSVIASRLETGQLSVLSYASMIVNMVNSILIGNLLIYCYPKIVKRIKESGSQTLFWQQTTFFHLVVCIVVAGFVTVGYEGIALLFEHGSFKAEATSAVFWGAMIYIAGQQFNIVRDLVYRYFYATGDTKTAASNSVLVSVVNITVSIILVNFIGLYGIIAGTVIASFVSLVRILFKFRKKIGFEIPFLRILRSLGVNILIMAVTIGAVLLTKQLFPIESTILSLLVFGTQTVVIFFGLTALFKRNILSVIKSL